jgi:pimeloyl-ACP methyl ester carboxylesterase
VIQPVLYLPGLDGEAFTSEKIAGHLSALKLHCFAYPMGQALSWESLSRLVAARMERLGTGLLVGESFGGALAQEVALRHPDAVRGVFLVSTFNAETEWFAAMLGRFALRVLPRGLMSLAARRLASWKLAGTLRGEDRRKFLDRFAALDFPDVGQRLALLKGFNTRDRLSRLQLPVDVVYASRDPIANDRAHLQAWESLPDCRVHKVEGFGHLVSAEAPEQVAERMEEWAARVERSG